MEAIYRDNVVSVSLVRLDDLLAFLGDSCGEQDKQLAEQVAERRRKPRGGPGRRDTDAEWPEMPRGLLGDRQGGSEERTLRL